MYASSKKQNMVCLSSGESELMALVGGACEGIATRPMEQIVQMLTWNDCSVHGHEGLIYASLDDGTWTTNLEGAW